MDAKRTATLIFLECGEKGLFMARKGQKHYPVVRKGKMFRPSPDSIGPNIEVNIEQLLSKVNRRLYRQARTYEAKIDLEANLEGSGQIHVYALADNWMNSQAMKMAYAMYLENSESERSRLGEQQIARWEDFRVMSGSDITQVDPLQYDAGFNAIPLTAGEFALTQVVDAAGVTKEFTWGNASGSRYSLLEEYDKAGDAQPAPSFKTNDVPYSDLMADDSAAMALDLQNRGDLPPYDATGVLEGSPWVRVATLSTGSSQKLSTGFFKAPCGIVIINASGAVNVADGRLSWEVKAGDYKGVSAPSMLE